MGSTYESLAFMGAAAAAAAAGLRKLRIMLMARAYMYTRADNTAMSTSAPMALRAQKSQAHPEGQPSTSSMLCCFFWVQRPLYELLFQLEE